MATARYFDADKYDGSQPRGGVPLRDIDETEWETYPQDIQASTDALPYFRKTKPRQEKREGDE